MKKSKREWYRRNRTSVRSQQNLHRWASAEIEKRLSAKRLGEIGTAEGISILNEFELRCPSFRTGHHTERWKGGELMESPKEMADRHESERAGLRQNQDEDKSAQIIEHRRQTRKLEERQAFERNGAYKQNDSQIIDPQKPAVDPSSL